MVDVLDSWLDEAKPATTEVQVCFDRDLVQRFEVAQAELDACTEEGMLEGPPADLVARVDALREEVSQKTRTLVFQNIGYQEWERLRAKHPPREEDEKQGLNHNGDTFPIVVTAASCAMPGMSVDQAEKFYATMPTSVCVRVYGAVMKVNLEAGDEKKALATVATLSSANK